jgi:PAS domain S-box-containing protein
MVEIPDKEYQQLKSRVKELEAAGAERKRAEETLKISEDKFEIIFENAPDINFMVDLKGNFVQANKAFEDVTGYKREEYVGKNFLQMGKIFPLDQLKNIPGIIADAIKNKSVQHEFEIIRKDGQRRIMSARAALIKIKDKNLILSIARDITDRKRAEEELKKTVQLLIDTGEMAKVGGWELDLTNNMVLMTEEVNRIHGLKPGEVLKLEEALNFYTPESRLEVEAVLKKAAETGEPYDLESLFIPLGSKDKIWVRSLGRAVRSGGKIVKIAGTFQNIDKYKRVEGVLQKSVEKYRILFETMMQGVVYQAADGKIISANPAAERVLGLTLDQLQGRTSIDPRWKSIHEDGSDFPGDTHPSMAALKTGQEVRNVTMGVLNPKDNSHHWININAIPLFRPGENKPYQVYATFEDITERKRVEEEIKSSETRYKSLFDHSSDILVQIDTSGTIIDLNQNAETIGGYKKEEIVGKSISALAGKFTIPSLASMVANFAKRKLGIKVGAYEVEAIGNAGQRLFFEVNAVPLKDSTGKETGELAVLHDITDRKRADEEKDKLSKFMVGREGRVIELKDEVNALLKELGRAVKYKE